MELDGSSDGDNGGGIVAFVGDNGGESCMVAVPLVIGVGRVNDDDETRSAEATLAAEDDVADVVPVALRWKIMFHFSSLLLRINDIRLRRCCGCCCLVESVRLDSARKGRA